MRQAEPIGQLEAQVDGLKKHLAGKAEAKTAKKPTFTKTTVWTTIDARRNDAKRDLLEHQHDVYWPNVDRQLGRAV